MYRMQYGDDQVDQYLKGNHHKLKDKEIAIVDKLNKEGLIQKKFNWIFFTNGDSKSPEYAGLYSAVIGSVLTLIITILQQFHLFYLVY